MSFSLGPRDRSAPSSKPRTNYVGWALLILAVVVLGGGGWYYFVGRKPKVVFSVPLKTDGGGFGGARGWLLPTGELLALAGDELKLCDLDGRKEKWSVKVPKLPPADPAWQASLATRFLRLQQWAAELAQKRAALTTPAAIKAFNEEVAKYQAELVSARADAVKIPPPPREPLRGGGREDLEDEEAAPGAPALRGAGARVEEAHIAAARAVVSRAAAQTDEAQGFTMTPPRPPAAAPARASAGGSAETKMLQDRIAKRAKSLAEMDQKIKAKTAAAKTDLARAEVKDLETKRAALAAEQKTDEASAAKALAGGSPGGASIVDRIDPDAASKVAMALQARESVTIGGDHDDDDEGGFTSFDEVPTQAFLVGDRIWLVGEGHAVAFAPADGAVKADVRVSGAVLRVFSNGTMLHIVAEAGPQARQLTKIDAAGASTALYVAAAAREPAFHSNPETGIVANIQAHRVEFSAASGALARVDIRLLQRQLKTRERIKPGAEQELTKAVEKSAGNSTDEALAMMHLMELDNERAGGGSTEQVDDSTYEVTISTPFEAAAVVREKFQGRVQVISSPSLHLITAGKRLVAIDHANKKLWETSLAAPVTQRSDETDWEENPPALLEQEGKLYFSDGAFLAALEMATGKVLWRLPSVGIRKVLSDADGNLFVQTDNLPVDSLYYAVTGRSDIPTSATLKVASDTGKILWEAPKFEDVWVSGKDVYAYREFKHAEDAANTVFDPSKVPEARVKVYKLSQSDGKPIWDWFQTRRPSQVFPRGKTVALIFRTEVQVIHSISF